MTIDALPTPPSRNNPATFADLGDAFMSALVPFGSQLNAAAIDVDAKQAAATASAAAAYASEIAATSASSATVWVSGTSYVIGNVRWSPSNWQSYRRKTNGAGTTDPASDSTNWVQLSTVPAMGGHVGEVLYTDGTSAYWSASVVTATGAYTLTNKTMSAATNDIEARSLKSATTTVSVSAATAPTTGQVLKATGPSSATWQTHSEFPTGTSMLFAQTSAPTGWTKSTTHDNKALRVVSGTAGSGGSTSFTSVFASRTPAGSVTVGATTLSTSQIPSHTHALTLSGSATAQSGSGANAPQSFGGTTSAEGGGGSHTHTASFAGTTLDFAVQYVDVIIATKD